MDVGGFDQRELAKRRGMTEGAVSQYIALTQLPAESQKNFSRLKLGLAHMTEILRSPNQEDQMKLAEETAKEDLTSKEVRSRVKKLLGKPEKAGAEAKEAVPPVPYHFTWKGAQIEGKLLFWPLEAEEAFSKGRQAFAEFLAQHPEPKKKAAEAAAVPVAATEEVTAVAA